VTELHFAVEFAAGNSAVLAAGIDQTGRLGWACHRRG
jgi:hypothetical protein